MAQLEFSRTNIIKIRVENTEGVQLSNVVSSHLVRAYEQLHLYRTIFNATPEKDVSSYLEVIIQFLSRLSMKLR